MKRRKIPLWQLDETKHSGTDFSSRKVVAAYDAFHAKFRDVRKENEAIISAIGLKKTDVIADFGCGTGSFVVEAARRCARAYAVDISKAMLDYARWKARQAGVRNIVFCNAGFLTYEHKGRPFDAIVSGVALHHLPDFWKQHALNRLSGMLKTGGKLLLGDVVLPETGYESAIEAWIPSLSVKSGRLMAENARRHIREEHSTFTWIMEGLLTRAGFRIDHTQFPGNLITIYLCTKVG